MDKIDRQRATTAAPTFPPPPTPPSSPAAVAVVTPRLRNSRDTRGVLGAGVAGLVVWLTANFGLGVIMLGLTVAIGWNKRRALSYRGGDARGMLAGGVLASLVVALTHNESFAELARFVGAGAGVATLVAGLVVMVGAQRKGLVPRNAQVGIGMTLGIASAALNMMSVTGTLTWP